MSGPADPRLEQLVSLLMRLAAGDLGAREQPSDVGDELDAVILGVNMLAEDLQASRVELEQRVMSRTAELAELNFEILKLTELGSLLQACESRAEAYEVLRHGVTVIFERLSGAVYLFNASRNNLQRMVAWGPAQHPDTLVREECWALRRGQLHLVGAGTLTSSCAHVSAGGESKSEEAVCIPMAARGETIGLLHLASPPGSASGVMSEPDVQLGEAVATQLALALTNLELRHTLRQQALRDPLTGLYNRRFIEDWMEREVNRSQHARTSLGVLMADIDMFKQVNDLHGHDTGDRIIKAVANVIQSSTRAGDVPCRYGGEEFLILVTDISHGDLVVRAEALREAVARMHSLGVDPPAPAVTMSIGAALYPMNGSSAAEVVKAADKALYAAKRAGRNQVSFAHG